MGKRIAASGTKKKRNPLFSDGKRRAAVILYKEEFDLAQVAALLRLSVRTVEKFVREALP